MRHPDPEKLPAQPIKHLWPRHQEMLRRIAAGDRPKDVAKDMGITESRLSIILKSPLAQERIRYLIDQADGAVIDVKRRLRWLSQQSMDLIEEALTKQHNEGGLTLLQRVKIAQDQLDRDGFGRVAITRGESVHLHVTSNDIQEMKSRINGEGPVNGSNQAPQRRLFGRQAGLSPAGRVMDVKPSGPDGPDESNGGGRESP